MTEADSWFRLIAAVIDRAKRDLGLMESDDDSHSAHIERIRILRDGGHPKHFLDDLDRFDPR